MKTLRLQCSFLLLTIFFLLISLIPWLVVLLNLLYLLHTIRSFCKRWSSNILLWILWFVRWIIVHWWFDMPKLFFLALLLRSLRLVVILLILKWYLSRLGLRLLWHWRFFFFCYHVSYSICIYISRQFILIGTIVDRLESSRR